MKKAIDPRMAHEHRTKKKKRKILFTSKQDYLARTMKIDKRLDKFFGHSV